MKWLMYFTLSVVLFSIVHAQDTGDTGFIDADGIGTTGLTEEELGALTSDQIALYIDSVGDLSLLDEYELNTYIEESYKSSIFS